MQHYLERYRNRELFGRTIPDLEIEILSWTLILAAPDNAIEWGTNTSEPADATSGQRELFDQAGGEKVTAQTVSRSAVANAVHIDGPALIEEDQTTTVVPKGWRATSTLAGHLRLDWLATTEKRS